MKTSASTGATRRAIVTLGLTAAGAALATQAGLVVRSLAPNVSYDPPRRFKIGDPAAFADGLTFVPERRLYVGRDGKQFRALSAVCTHLGCTVHAEAVLRPDPTDPSPRRGTQIQEFACPCHGSRYTADGAPLSGPAPAALTCYRLSLAPDDGQLVVDLEDEVGPGFRLTVA